MLNVGLIGYGYWGPNLARNIAGNPHCRLVAVCDADPQRRTRAAQERVGVEVGDDPLALCDDPRIEAVCIATPPDSHFELAMRALERGKHVLLTKPMARTVEQAERLVAAAERAGRVLLLDHTFLFTGAVRKIKEEVAAGRLGTLQYYDSIRANLGIFYAEANVLWDLAVHDLSILAYLMPERPVAVSACAVRHVPGQPENIAYLTLHYESGFIAHINVNWLAPVKVRRTLIGGADKMLAFDDMEIGEKIRIYDKGVTLSEDPEVKNRFRVGYRNGDMYAPRVDSVEALAVEIEHFVACVEGRETPLADGASGVWITQVLEKAAESIEQRGAAIPLTVPPVPPPAAPANAPTGAPEV